MPKKLRALLLPLFIFLFSAHIVFARNPYVLPYPGVMPGNRFYKAVELLDTAKKYYFFGDFSQFKYELSMSDKKLVEAKTLFEYGQYLLAVSALHESDQHFSKTLPHLIGAEKNKKNTKEKRQLLREASLKHQEILISLKQEIPALIIWREEKKKEVQLNLHEDIQKAISIRKSYE